MSVRLSSERWGDGPLPAVLLHGFTGSAASFDHLRKLLSPALSVVALNLPGHGGSPVAVNGGSAWEATVDSVATSLARAHGGPAHLIGYSMGARVALAVALRHPELVRTLVLESGTAGIRAAPLRAERVAQDEALAQLLEREGVPAFVARWEETTVLAELRKLPADLIVSLRARRLAQSAAGLAWSLRMLGAGAQPDLWPALRSLRARTLLLHGAKDDKFRALAEKMALRIPDATLREIRGAGHSPNLERPALYAAALLDFVAAAQSATAPTLQISPGSQP